MDVYGYVRFWFGVGRVRVGVSRGWRSGVLYGYCVYD